MLITAILKIRSFLHYTKTVKALYVGENQGWYHFYDASSTGSM